MTYWSITSYDYSCLPNKKTMFETSGPIIEVLSVHHFEFLSQNIPNYISWGIVLVRSALTSAAASLELVFITILVLSNHNQDASICLAWGVDDDDDDDADDDHYHGCGSIPAKCSRILDQDLHFNTKQLLGKIQAERQNAKNASYGLVKKCLVSEYINAFSSAYRMNLVDRPLRVDKL